MRIIVSGRNTEVTETLKERLTKKLGKLDKFFNPDTEAQATFSKEKSKHIVDVTIQFNSTVFRAEEKNDDMFTSIDRVVDTLEGQIRKNKTKAQKKKIQGVILKGRVPSSKPDEETSKGRFKVLEAEKYSVKPMTLEEAVMQLNLSKDPYFMFSNSDTKQVNMVYKISGNTFGLVEPDLD